MKTLIAVMMATVVGLTFVGSSFAIDQSAGKPPSQEMQHQDMKKDVGQPGAKSKATKTAKKHHKKAHKKQESQKSM